MIGRDTGGVEDHLGGNRGAHAHLVLGRGGTHPLARGRDMQAADPACPVPPGRLPRGAGEHRVEVGLAGV